MIKYYNDKLNIPNFIFTFFLKIKNIFNYQSIFKKVVNIIIKITLNKLKLQKSSQKRSNYQMSEFENFQQKYQKLLIQFNSYRQKIELQKQTQLRQFEKYRTHLDKTYKQIQKKYDSKLQQQRISYQKKLKKIQGIYRQKQQDLTSIIQAKNKFIQELKKKINQVQIEKHQIVENNTKMLYDLSEGMENSEQILGPNKSSYQDLARLYQFVLQQNNNLKKQLFRVELKQKQKRQVINSQQQNKMNMNKLVHIPKDPKEDKKQKKTTKSSFENSRSHNESMKQKNVTSSGKKEAKK